MPQRSATLHVSQPCSESWAAMTPTPLGRHCAACQKTVVDFTQKTDAEILAYLARAGSQPCGRFRAEQLARPLMPAEPTSRWRSWLGAVLALGGVLGSSRAAAQAGGSYFSAGPTPAAVSPAAPGATPAPPKAAEPPITAAPSGAGGPLLVRGVVADATTGEPLPGVTVLLQGTTRGVSTSMDGKFELALTEQNALGTLLVSYIGYSTQRLPLATANTESLTVKLAADVQGMGEVIIIGGYGARRPWPWHPRALYRWGKHWLTRPFKQ